MLITTAVLSALSNKGGSSGNAAYIEAGILKSDGNADDSLMPKNRSSGKFGKLKNTFPFKAVKMIGSGIAVLLLAAIAVFTVGSGFYGPEFVEAWANDNAEEALDEYESDAEEQFSEITDDESLSGFQISSDRDAGLGYVAWRMLIPGYLNDVELAVAPSSDGETIPSNTEQDWMCSGLRNSNNEREPLYGTPMYHNCDVPNLAAEAGQSALSWFAKSGVQGAEVKDPKPAFGFGVPHPDIIPDGNVPVDRSDSNNKYTGLEIYGYNLNYTTYAGEWDNVGTLPEARILANFGFADRLNLGGNAVWNGITGSIESAGQNLSESWDSAIDAGGIRYVTAPVEALWGAVTGAASGGWEGTIKTFLDTMDYNVFSQYAWYRKADYTSTLYGNVRELNQEEMAELADRRQRSDMLESWWEALASHDVQGLEETEALMNFPAEEPVIKDQQEVDQWENEESDYINRMADWNSANERYNNLVRRCAEEEGEPNAPDCPTSDHDGHPSNEPGYNQYEIFDPTAPEDGYPQYDYEEFQDWVDETPLFNNVSPELSQHDSIVSWTQPEQHNDDFQTMRDGWLDAVQAQMMALVGENFDMIVDDMIARFACRIAPDFICDSAEKYGTGEERSIDRDLPPSHPINRFVCPDPESGNIYKDPNERLTVRNLYSHVGPGPNDSEYLTPEGMVRTTNSYDCPTEVRPPIQNGVFGNGYTDDWQGDTGRTPPGTDTRNEEFSALSSVIPAFLTPTGAMNAISEGMLWVSVRFASFSNFLIDIAFNPPIQWLGFDEVVVSMIESFRDSMFFPLSALAATVGAVAIFMTHIRKREYRQGWWSVAMIFIVFVTGFFVMRDPSALVTAADEVPSNVENTLAAAVFSGLSTSNDNMCSPGASQTPNQAQGSDYEETTGAQGVSFDTGHVVRAMQCEVWRNFAFTPWTFGQFGTSYQNLEDSNMQNTNEALVGSPTVHLGNGQTMNNWALYQLETTTSGTITTADGEEGIGHIDPNMYRLVDLQAGPNNAERSDTRHFDRWSGNDSFGRAMDTMFSIVASSVGMVAIFLYVMIKLEYTLYVTILLLITPIVFLIGIEPTKGRSLLRKWFGSVVGAMLKRIFAVFLLAIMLAIMTAAAGTLHTSYLHVAVILTIIALAFILYRKEFMRWMEDVGNKAGNGSMGQDGHSMPVFGKMFQGSSMKALGKAGQGLVAGGTAGAIKGATKGAKSEFTDAMASDENWGTSFVKAAGGTLKHTVQGSMHGAEQSSNIAMKRALVAARSEIGLDLLSTQRDLKSKLDKKFNKSIQKEKFNDASREVALEDIAGEITHTQSQLNDYHKQLENEHERGENADESMKSSLEKQIEEIQSRLDGLTDEQQRIKYSEDWKTSMLGDDLNSDTVQRRIRHHQKRLKKKGLDHETDATQVGSDKEFNRITSISGLEGDRSYVDETNELNAQRSRRHHEMNERRAYIINSHSADDRNKILRTRKDSDEARRQQAAETAREDILDRSEYSSWDELTGESSPAVMDRYNAVIEKAVADEDSKISDEVDKRVTFILREKIKGMQFGHERYAGYRSTMYDENGEKKEPEGTVSEVMGELKDRQFVSSLDETENEGMATKVIRINDPSTGSDAEITIEDDGDNQTVSASVKHSGKESTDLIDKKDHDGNLTDVMDSVLDSLRSQSIDLKKRDNVHNMTSDGRADERASYENHRKKEGGREFRTHNIPAWASQERVRISEEINNAKSQDSIDALKEEYQNVIAIEEKALDELADMKSESSVSATQALRPVKLTKEAISIRRGRKRYSGEDYGGVKSKSNTRREIEHEADYAKTYAKDKVNYMWGKAQGVRARIKEDRKQ